MRFHRFSFLIPWLCFLLTLLPLGFGHTLYGTMAAVLSATVFGLSLSLFAVIVVMSDIGERRFFAPQIKQLKRLFFEIPAPYFLAVVVALFFVISLAISYFSNGCVPSIQDSAAQLIHARMLVAGHATLPAYPLGEFFNLGVMVNDARYYSQYSPGHIILLALGVLADFPCAVNPLIGGLTVLAVYHLAALLYNQSTARIAALLSLTSPFLLHMSAEYMNHATSLLFTTVFFLGFLKSVRTPSLWWPCIAGFSLAYVGITRPLTMVGIALPAVCYGFMLILRQPRIFAPRCVLMAVAASVPFAALLWFNQATTGDMFTLGYQKLASSRLGFGPVPTSMLPWVTQADHTLWHGIGMAFNNWNAMHWFLFLWPGSSLIFLPLAFMTRRVAAGEKLLLFTCLSLTLAYVPYYFQSWGAGPRFLYEITGILIIFTACGIMRTPELLCGWMKGDIEKRLAFVLFGCIIFAIGFMLHGLATSESRAEKLLAIHTLETRLTKPTLLFMPFGEEYWRLAAITYPVTEASRLIVANDLGEANKQLMKLYPGYDAFRASNIGTDKEVWERLR